jgi:outer membrane protein assembly factor BamE (lipoprotein component of BamABCDE complex)
MIGSLLGLLACDPSGRAYEDARLARLTEGQSTEQDVRQLFGVPSATREIAGGKGLIYPLGPEGLHTLLLRIDPNGKYQGRENLLTRDNFNRVAKGQSQSDVLDLLGRPGRTEKYALKQQTAWEWRFLDGNVTRVFVVMFDPAGTVVSSAIEEDPRLTGGS